MALRLRRVSKLQVAYANLMCCAGVAGVGEENLLADRIRCLLIALREESLRALDCLVRQHGNAIH